MCYYIMDKETMKKYILDYFEITYNIKSNNSYMLKNDLKHCILFNENQSIYINEEIFVECMKELYKYKKSINGNQYKFNCKNKINQCHICGEKYNCNKVGIYKHKNDKKHIKYLKKV